MPMLASFRAILIVGSVATLLACSPQAPQPPAAQGEEAALREGEGSELVQATCTSCHGVNMITRSSGYTRAHWEALAATMVELPEEQKAQILDYLAQAYPPNQNRAARRVDGPLQVTFQEWVAPRLGERSRDPVQAPDGSVWWVGQRGNNIGHLNPATGEMQEWSLPAEALPHSVNVDAQGRVWYMGNGNGTIGLFDPATGRATEYRMPDEAARDPHTAEFDRNGIMWFTLQQSNMIGRFDPRSGEVRLVTVERERSRPYGVKIDAQGNPWVACNGSNCIIRVNPQTMTLTIIDLPGDETHVRRLDIASDGTVWYVNSGMGKLGRYTPSTGEIREWDSPSGPDSHPYAIDVVNDIVWYNESGVRPDMLVRFDPRTETFQSWPIPSGGVHAGIVRHMRANADGDLWLHQSSTNRIIRARLPPAN